MKLDEKVRNELRRVADEFLSVVKEKVDMHVIHCDSEGLGQLVMAVDMVSGWQLIRNLRKKGFSKEIADLCDKAGMVKK